ncbi:hypothetical protein BH11BAC7_BH11BAC7_25990 [soil metagenome]
MMRLIFLFLFLPAYLPAQFFFEDPLSPGKKAINLPIVKRLEYSGEVFIIKQEADYKALFADSVQASLPEIDFSVYELVADYYCVQCGVCCGGRPQPRHRNACRYTRTWHLQNKQQRVMLTAEEMDGKACSFFPFFNDEIICSDDSSYQGLQGSCPGIKKDSVDFSQRIVIGSKMYIDCAAKIEHEFYLDTIRHCLVWRFYSGYGGCRKMNERSFIFSLPKPPPGYTIRFEKYGLPSEY